MVTRYDPAEIPSVYHLDELPQFEKRPGVTQQYFRGLDTLVGFTHITPNKEPSEPHSHPWEQLNYVVEGECDFHVGDEVVTVSSGDLLVIPPDVPHTSEPPSGPCTICFVGPLREDYAAKINYQDEFEVE